MAREPTRLLCSVFASLCIACGPARLASDGGDESDSDDHEHGAVPAQLPQDLTLTISPIKQFELAWTDVAEDQQYQVLEREHPDAPFVPAGPNTFEQTVSPPNPGEVDRFGYAVAVSVDASTLVVGASLEDGGASGIGGNPGDDSASSAGAVYVY